jgi:trehalose-phosphatase
LRRRGSGPIDIARVAILLDVDGTILDVAATPQSVVVPASLVQILSELHVRTNGAVALISGRLIENLDDLFVPLKLPCVGGHGVEWRISGSAPVERRYGELSALLKKQVTTGVPSILASSSKTKAPRSPFTTDWRRSSGL